MLRANLILCSMAFSLIATAQDEGPRNGHHEITEEQHNCLTKALGEPGAGERPTKEKAEAAFKSCGMDAPKGPPPRERHHPELNAEQKNCLSKALGAPVPGERPSREKMQAALKSCGVEFPKGPPEDKKAK